MSKKEEKAALQPEVEISKFKPFAYFDKHLDCIRVQLHDCSIVEQRQNRIFTVLKAAHGTRSIVGVNIKGVRHMVRQMGLDLRACYTLAQIISIVVKAYPEKYVQEIAEQLAPLLKQESLDTTEIRLDAVAA